MRAGWAVPLLALAAGCTVGPDYAGPPAAPSEAGTRGRFVRAEEGAVPAPPLARWWEALGDPTLNALIDDALAHSPNIDAAQARIREARARLRQQRAAGLPTLSASGTAAHADLPGVDLGAAEAGQGGGDSGGGGGSQSLTFYNLGATASWEPDLFGGARRGTEQARATLGQRYADLADAQVSLTAQLAQAYVGLRDVQARQRLTSASSALQRRQLELTEQRRARGSASELDVVRLRNQLESTDAQAIPLAAQTASYLDQIAVLTGREPGTLDATLKAEAAIPLPPAQVAVGDPAALIARRPDIRAAERALAAGTAQIGIDKARLFPGLRFMGILGLGGTDPGDVLDPDNLSTILAPMLSWSFLDWGRNQAVVRTSEAQRDAAEAQYRQTVLAALQDAESSLARFGATRRQLATLLRAETAAARAAELNGQRVRAGASSLIDQLDIERQRLSAQVAVAQARGQLTDSYVAVQKALGLGWAEPAEAPAGR